MRFDINLEHAPELDADNYINRELSWVDFNTRVLAQAEDESLPLLERLKFLAIVSSNTDEFFMVRVATIHKKLALNVPSNRPDGIPYPVLIEEVRARVLTLMQRQRELMRTLLGQLRNYGVMVDAVSDLPKEYRHALREHFFEEIFPVLTPLAVDHARPFPFISNLSMNLAICLRRKGEPDEQDEFVRVKIPDTMPRLLNVNDVVRKHGGELPTQERFVWIEDLIAENLDLLFPGMKVVEFVPFRVTRNADIDFENEREDHPYSNNFHISDIIEESIKERRFGSIVRLAVPDDVNKRALRRLLEHLEIVPERDLYRVNGALGGASLFQLTGIDHPELKYTPYVPKMPALMEYDSIFDAIRERDWLVHHPYDSFAPVEAFFQQAARDPNVLAIKATLYRVGRNSPVVQALMEARDNNKQVAVLVELKARFDEEHNLEWARQMDEAGIHVTYGVEELPVKTHAKIALVVRREPDGVHRYVHLGTGNYNAATARLYTDMGLFTANKVLADDASKLFNRLTGYAPATTYQRLLVAPEFLLPNLAELIDHEIAAAREGKDARLIFKMNQLEEDLMIRKLYEASQAGVQVDLMVRGICCLRPGIPGISENIRVRSIVGRYLEHSRIFYFHNAPPDRRIYMGSADLMRRNLYNRVEVVFPVLDQRLQRDIVHILETYTRDNTQAWDLAPDGVYHRLQPAPGEEAFSAQEAFMTNSLGLS